MLFCLIILTKQHFIVLLSTVTNKTTTIMRKIFAIICVAIMGLGTAWGQASKGDFAVGANVVYGSGIENVGLGARVQYTVFDNFRTETSFNYFFKNDGVDMWDVNLNAHYLFGLASDKLYLYPIAGVSFARTTSDFGNDSAFGLNLGAGAEYRLTDQFGLSLEYRHSIMEDIDQGVFSLGVNYKF